MELLILNSFNQPVTMVERYDSLIWTERFNTVGDFQLTTGDVERFMNLMPEGTILSLRDSNIAMVVETHQISKKKNSATVLTIKGRSFESILDRRVSIPTVRGGSVSEWVIGGTKPSDIAWQAMVAICVNGWVSSYDIFPASEVTFPTPPDYDPTPLQFYKVPAGNMLSTVLTYLQTETDSIRQHGIRAVRPNTSGTAITIEIYEGVDRSTTVYFDSTRLLLDDGAYLFSKVGSATTAYVVGGSDSNLGLVIDKYGDNPSGLARRVILVDASASSLVYDTELMGYGEAALANASETAIFDGTLNADLSPYLYGRDYFLGDTVRLVGDYGLDRKARVTEYIRSDDVTGSKAYPTLVSL